MLDEKAVKYLKDLKDANLDVINNITIRQLYQRLLNRKYIDTGLDGRIMSLGRSTYIEKLASTNGEKKYETTYYLSVLPSTRELEILCLRKCDNSRCFNGAIHHIETLKKINIDVNQTKSLKEFINFIDLSNFDFYYVPFELDFYTEKRNEGRFEIIKNK